MIIEKCNVEDDEDISLIDAENAQQSFNPTINKVMNNVMGL